MFIPYFQVFVPVFGLLINVFTQAAGMRFVLNLTLLKSVMMGFAAGLSSVLGLEWYLGVLAASAFKAWWPLLLTNLLIYGALGYGYFHFINLGETARRIRILRELAEAPTGLALADILTRYNAQQIVALRLRRLIQNGQVVERDGRYYSGRPVMLLIARSITFLKWFILGKTSEFDG